MSYLPLAPRQWEHNRQAAGIQPFTDLVRILLLAILTQSPHLTRGAAGVSLWTLPCRGFPVCRDRTVRPTGRVKYLLCCVFSCKGAVQRISASSGYHATSQPVYGKRL